MLANINATTLQAKDKTSQKGHGLQTLHGYAVWYLTLLRFFNWEYDKFVTQAEEIMPKKY